MKRLEDIVEQIEALQRSDLELWISEEFVAPQDHAGSMVFSEMECARIRLISTLRYELEIEADTLPVILSLVDQLYQTRQRLLKLTAAVAAQDEPIRQAILAAIDWASGIEEEA